MSDLITTITQSDGVKNVDDIAQSEEATRYLALSTRYFLLSRLLADAHSSEFAVKTHCEAAIAACNLLSENEFLPLIQEISQTLPNTRDEVKAAYTDMFGLMVSGEIPPYEVEYEDRADLFWRSQQLADIAGFYKAYRLDLATKERVDHISIEAEFLAYLLERLAGAHLYRHDEDKKLCLESTFRSFFQEHFGRWSGNFGRRLQEIAKRRNLSYYQNVALWLQALVTQEHKRLSLDEPAITELQPVPVDKVTTDTDTCDAGECGGGGGGCMSPRQ